MHNNDTDLSSGIWRAEEGSGAVEMTVRSVADAVAIVPPGGTCSVSGLYGASKAYLVSRLFAETKRPVLAVLPTGDAADGFVSDLRFFLGKGPVRLYPAPEVLPFELQSPHQDILSARLEVLSSFASAEPSVIVTTAANLMQRVVPAGLLQHSTITLRSSEGVELGGGPCTRDQLVARLLEMGYSKMSMVEERGELSVRGGILDIFAPGHARPLRVEFFGDEVDTIRSFDIATQRSIETLDTAVILPAREADFSDDARRRARERFIERAEELALDRDDWAPLSARIRDGINTAGMYGLLPLFYDRLDTFFDYLSTGAGPGDGAIVAVVEPGGVNEAMEEFAGEVRATEARMKEAGKFYVRPDEFYLSPAELRSALEAFPVASLESFRGAGPAVDAQSNIDLAGELAIRRRPHQPPHAIDRPESGDRPSGGADSELPLAPLAARIEEWLSDGFSVTVTAHNRGQAERMVELLEGYGLRAASVNGLPALPLSGKTDPRLSVAAGSLTTGFRLPSELMAIVTEEEIFGERAARRPPPKKKLADFLTQLSDLSEGDNIVHAAHGIGLYRGLERIEVGGVGNDFLLIEYRGGDKLYLPVWRMDLVSSYRGVEGRTAELDRLGGTNWAKTKGRVRESVERLAGELLKLYAERRVADGFAFSDPGRMFREFATSFEYEETPDQARAIEEVMADMGDPSPMDRLVCGDVGYGKTEVAMRAAFRAVLDGKQVAILVPTTVLAQQHFNTFSARFAPYPVTVEVLSRFRTAKEQKAVTAGVKAGTVDILIGTHRLLGKDVAFKDLGLIVVDEEHRFGVAHKERLKQMRKKVDVLTLTATPIPRTLNMAMASVRELSIISTPPEDRQAIRTSIVRFDEAVIAEAIERELNRGGQIFFVHNRIQSMPAMAGMLARIAPRARVATAHGQMPEAMLEKRMVGFVRRDFDILLSTAIIESGLDIPSANTIIINRADRFGLAELYQLRGRVGRSSHRAYAYLLCPESSRLTDDARKRIEVIGELTEAGSGFKVASYDLEIRGAGELLGTQQSGRIAEVGFDLYVRLLEEAVAELRGETVEEEFTPEINISLSRYIPEEYVPDTRQRLGLYKRLASVGEEDEIAAMRLELEDRYGALPEMVENLLETTSFKLTLKRVRAVELAQKANRLYITLAPHPDPAVGEVVGANALRLMTEEPNRFRVTPDSRFIVFMGPAPRPLEEARYVLKELSRGCYS